MTKVEKELVKYVREGINEDDLCRAWEQIDRWRCPLSHADGYLYGEIESLISDFCLDNDLDECDFDVEEIFHEL